MYCIIGADQKEYGPVSAEQLRQWLAQGRMNAQTRVKTEGATDWVALGTVPELAGGFASRPAAEPTSSGGGVNTVIPYKNPWALVAYYLAIFSLIPVIGLILGLAAFVLGLLGLRYRKRNPTSGGAAHAWIGIVLGGLTGFGHVLLILLAIAAALNSR